MNLPKTIRQIYREETGKDAEIASPLEGFELAVYVEAPSKDYIDWLESRASKTGGNTNTFTNIGSPKLPTLEECQKEVQSRIWAGGFVGTSTNITEVVYKFICRHIGCM